MLFKRSPIVLSIIGLLLHLSCKVPVEAPVNPGTNFPPKADAGNDATVFLGQTLQLRGTASDEDGHIIEYAWRFGPYPEWIITSSGDTSFIVEPPPGSKYFVFRVTDDDDNVAYDSCKITIRTQPPRGYAGRDTTVQVNGAIHLHGRGSDDYGDIKEFAWKFGLSQDWVITSTGDTIVKAASTARIDTFVIRVKDGEEQLGYDSVVVTIKEDSIPNVPPTADAGQDVVVMVDEQIQLRGVGSDSDGRIVEYAWRMGVGQSWAVTSTGDTTLVAVAPARTETFAFRVKDNDGAFGFDSILVTVKEDTTNIPPTAEAGNDTSLSVNDTIRLRGVGNDPDGSIVEYAWKIGGSGWQPCSNGDTNVVAPSTAQQILCVLRVKDNREAVAFDSLTVTVNSISFDPWIPSGPLERKGKMVKVMGKGYGFSMGSNQGEAIEKPVHRVRFTYDFWIDSTEVTQKEYDGVMKAGYTTYQTPDWSKYGTGDTYPAYHINWHDAVLYCNALSKARGLDTLYAYTSISGQIGHACKLRGLSITMEANGYRLPTEAEWEYACRGGTTSQFYWGSASHNDYAWFKSNSDHTTNITARKKPNRYGLYDMCGNVFEWINDWQDTYGDSVAVDPIGPENGSMRVLRGGNAFEESNRGRSAFRFPAYAGYELTPGFRVVLPIK